MFNKDKIQTTLLQYFLNELSPSERKAVEAWIEETPENRHYFEELRKNHIWIQGAMQLNAIQTTYQKWQTRIHRQIRLRRIRLSAAIITLLLAMGTGIYFVNHFSVSSSLPLAENTIQPGSSQAILHLSSGKTVSLREQPQELKEKDGTLINVSKKGTLNYISSGQTPGNTELLNKLEIPRGGEFKLTLADSTEVWLNSETELQYPTTFSQTERTVKLTGEAYFKVAKNPDHPFFVEVGELKIKVYGTQFNINTLHKGKIETVLVNGSISIFYQDQEILLKPSQKAKFTPANGQISVSEVNILPYIAWKEGNFMFLNESLESILDELARWYDLEIFYQQKAAKNIYLSGMLERYNDIHKLLHYFEKISPARFKIQGKTIVVDIHGGENRKRGKKEGL